MQVHTDPAQIPSFRQAVITIGTFDGVHLGHRMIIGQLVAVAAAVGGESVLITFHPHPRQIVQPETAPLRLLTSLAERQQRLAALGVDHLVVIPFTEAFASMEAAEFIASFLVQQFRPHTIIIGHDHRFGRGRHGDYQMLETAATHYGFTVLEMDAALLRQAAISSTRIREALLAGEVTLANELLGYAYTFGGRVVPGKQRGRTIGFPTANLEVSDETEKLMPADGVYAVRIGYGGQTFDGMMNLGKRPTVDGQRHTTEVHLFNFDGDLYGQHLDVSVEARIRNEERFSSLEALQRQLSHDRKAILKLLHR